MDDDKVLDGSRHPMGKKFYFQKLCNLDRSNLSIPFSFLLVLLSLLFLFISEMALAETFTRKTGGECVAYARANTNCSSTTCPSVGGARNIYGSWNYGFGKDPDDPAKNSLIVLDKTATNPYGHVGIVRRVTPLENGLYELRVDESNVYTNEATGKLDGYESTNARYHYSALFYRHS